MNTTMKASALLFSLILMACSPSRAQNYIFSSYQCDPTSCVEIGPAAKTESVLVTFTGVCTGGAVENPLNLSAYSFVENCSVPYIPYASTEVSRLELYNEDGCSPYEYEVDYVTPTTEIFTASGQVYWYQEVTYGCDGSTTGVTTFGTKPC